MPLLLYNNQIRILNFAIYQQPPSEYFTYYCYYYYYYYPDGYTQSWRHICTYSYSYGYQEAERWWKNIYFEFLLCNKYPLSNNDNNINSSFFNNTCVISTRVIFLSVYSLELYFWADIRFQINEQSKKQFWRRRGILFFAFFLILKLEFVLNVIE